MDERSIAGLMALVVVGPLKLVLLVEPPGSSPRSVRVAKSNAAGEIERFPQRMSGESEVFSPACYPLAATDGDGQPLDSEHRYTLHFEHDQLPPGDQRILVTDDVTTARATLSTTRSTATRWVTAAG